MDPQQLDRGHVVAGRYQVERMLGMGGMGAVYVVVDSHTERRRALKVMLASLVANDDLRKRFDREARVAARIESEHVADVVDAGVDDRMGLPFIVQELLDGDDLGARLERGETFGREETLALLEQAALALDKAHAVGVVHRDLKPENMFLTRRDDGSPWLKLLDFGIAKIVTDVTSDARTTGILGSPIYMAPEQVTGESNVSAQTDVHAIGHVVYHLIVGEPYWTPEQSALEGVYPLLLRIAEGTSDSASARASTVGKSLGASFDRWFATSTALAPANRFGSVGEQVRALRQALAPPHRTARSRAWWLLPLSAIAGAGGVYGMRKPEPAPIAPVVATSAASTAMPALTVARDDTLMAGLWTSSSGRKLEAVWNGEAFELRIRDPTQFAGQLYERGEARFLLRREGKRWRVTDRLRTRHAAFDERARDSCLIELDRVNDRPLEARLDGDTLVVELVQLTQSPSLFVRENGFVIGCRHLDDAPRAIIESRLSR